MDQVEDRICDLDARGSEEADNLANDHELQTFLGNFCKGVKIYHFYSEIILGNFYRHLAIFIWSHCS